MLNGCAAISAMIVLWFWGGVGFRGNTLLWMQVAYDLAQVRLSGK